MKHCPKQHLEQASVAEGMRTGHLGVCNPFGTYYYTVVSLIMTISSHTKELKHLGLRNKSTWVQENIAWIKVHPFITQCCNETAPKCIFPVFFPSHKAMTLQKLDWSVSLMVLEQHQYRCSRNNTNQVISDMCVICPGGFLLQAGSMTI